MIAAKLTLAGCRRPVASLAALLAFSSVALQALAEERDPAAAEALFREGKQLMADGLFERACPKLAESYRLDPATGALLATALCYERAGRIASAWAAYTDVAARAKAERAFDREQSARAKAAELETKLDRLVVSVSAAETPGLVVTRDGAVIGQPEWGTPVPVDPGSHVVEASAPGKASFRVAVTVRGAATQRVSVPELREVPSASAPLAAGKVPPTKAAPPPEAAPSEAPGFWTPLRATGTVTAGVGLVGVAVGAVFGARALSRNADSNKDGHCNENKCDTIGSGLRNEARDAGDIATIAMVGGLALVAGGVTLFALGAPADPAVGVWLSPPVAGNGKLVFRGTF